MVNNNYTTISIKKELSQRIEDIREKKGLRSNPKLIMQWVNKEEKILGVDLLEYQPEKPYLVELMKDALELCGHEVKTRDALKLALIVEKWNDEE